MFIELNLIEFTYFKLTDFLFTGGDVRDMATDKKLDVTDWDEVSDDEDVCWAL